jgi:hypothetical protein
VASERARAGHPREWLSRTLLSVLAIALTIELAACRKPQAITAPLIDEAKPVLVIGSDEPEATGPGNYRIVLDCKIDVQGNIYIPDQVENRIDKYDPRGNYLHSIGRPGQGPGEFQGIGFFAVNSRGEVYAYSFSRLSIMTFESDGRFREEIKLPAEFRSRHVVGIKVDPDDRVYLVFLSRDAGSLIARFASNFESWTAIHVDKRRRGLDNTIASGALPPLYLDFAFDEKGDLYVPDAIDYRVYVHDSDGKLTRTFEQERPRKEYSAGDLVRFFSGKVQDYSDWGGYYIGSLKGDDRFLPNIFGIDVDQGRIYLWTSDRDENLGYVIDIYDKDFDLLGHSLAYEWLQRRQIVIRNGRLYTPDLAPEDLNAVRKVGRLSWLNEPSKLLVYDILWPKGENRGKVK